MTPRLLVFGLVLTALGGAAGCSGAPAPTTDAGGIVDAPSPSDVPAVGAAPVATINHPGEGESRAVSVAVPMIGVATDAEDGTFADAALIWTSDVEGAIGTGAMWMWTPTTTGPQIVTLTVTDSDGQVGTDTVTLTITP